MKKKIIFGLLFSLLILIQFIPISKNDSIETTNSIFSKHQISPNLKKTLDIACADCHSNHTIYPWYFSVQPVGWWLNRHIQGGKKHLNFSEFNSYSKKKQSHKLEECIELVQNGEMPLKSYTYFGLHSEAKLTDEQRKELIEWFKHIKLSVDSIGN